MSELIEALRETSPQVWEALLRQVKSDAVLALVWGVIFLVYVFLAIPFLRGVIKSRHKLESGDELFYVAAILIGAVTVLVASMGALICFSTYAQMIYNPDYYAIQLFIKSLLK